MNLKICRCNRCGWLGWEEEITIPGHCPECQEYEGLEVCGQDMAYTKEELRGLWLLFSDVSITDEDCIEEEYLGFPAGTYRFDVWLWFDVRWPGGVYSLAYEGGEHDAG